MLAALLFVTATAALPAAPSESPRLLVVDLEVRGADPSLRAGTTALVVSAAAAAGRFEVIAGDDVKRALELAATQQAAGCDATSCLDEIAGALGARFVLFGDLTRLDDQTLLTLSVFDNEVVRSVARASAVLPPDKPASEVVERLVRLLVREFDAYRGAFPTTAVVGGAGTLAFLGGLALVGVGGWQLALLGEDGQRHDRLLEDFEDSRDPALAKEAAAVQRDAEGHAAVGATLVGIGIPLCVAGAGTAGWALWKTFE